MELVSKRAGEGYEQPLGSRGLKTVGGQILEEYQKELRTLRQRVAMFAEMANHPVLGAALLIYVRLLSGVHYRIEPKEALKEDARAAEVAARVNQSLNTMDTAWEDFISEVLTMLTFGFATMERTFRIDADGWLTFADIALRPAETIWEWKWDRDNLVGIKQQLTMTELQDTTPEIPIEDIYLFRTEAIKNNPEGRSIFRSSYEPYVRSKNHRDLEAIGHEKDATGTPVVRVPKEVAQAQAGGDAQLIQRKQNANNVARRLKAGQEVGLVLSSEVDPDTKTPIYDVSLLKSPGERQFDANPIIDRLTREMLFPTGTDVLLLGHEKTGAISEGGTGETKDKLLKTILNSLKDRILDVFNSRMIPEICDLNGVPKEIRPEAKADEIEDDITLTDLINALKELAAAGMPLLPDDQIENVVRSRMRLPMKKANQEV